MPIEDVLTTRTALQGFIPPKIATNLVTQAVKGVDFLSQLNVRQMDGPVEQTTYLNGVIASDWVGVDADAKPVGKIGSINTVMYSEEVAVIVAISDNTINDVDGDIVGALEIEAADGIGDKIATTLLYGGMPGYTKPNSLPLGLVPAAIAAGNVIQYGSVPNADIADYISGVYGLVEGDGFDVSNVAIDRSLKATLRNARDKQGNFLYQQSMQAGTPSVLYGIDGVNVSTRQWDPTKALLLAFDKNQVDVAVWTKMAYKVSTDGTLVLPDGSIFSALQRDSTLIRLNIRIGYRYKLAVGTKFPAAILTSAA